MSIHSWYQVVTLFHVHPVNRHTLEGGGAISVAKGEKWGLFSFSMVEWAV